MKWRDCHPKCPQTHAVRNPSSGVCEPRGADALANKYWRVRWETPGKIRKYYAAFSLVVAALAFAATALGAAERLLRTNRRHLVR